MPERAATERYLRELNASLVGSRRSRQRLLTELHDHIDDAISATTSDGLDQHEAERRALAQLGPASTLAAHWQARTGHARKRHTARAAAALVLATLASVLAITSAASGRRDPTPPPCLQTTTPNQCTPPTPQR